MLQPKGGNGSQKVLADSNWTRIVYFFSDLDPVSLENVDPNLILLITFKLTIDVCQNIW